MQLYG